MCYNHGQNGLFFTQSEVLILYSGAWTHVTEVLMRLPRKKKIHRGRKEDRKQENLHSFDSIARIELHTSFTNKQELGWHGNADLKNAHSFYKSGESQVRWILKLLFLGHTFKNINKHV